MPEFAAILLLKPLSRRIHAFFSSDHVIILISPNGEHSRIRTKMDNVLCSQGPNLARLMQSWSFHIHV